MAVETLQQYIDRRMAEEKIPAPDHSFLRGARYPAILKRALASYEAEVVAEYSAKQRFREEYALLTTKGDITPPSRVQRLRQIATGHPDKEATQAAIRILNKLGEQP